MSGLPLLYCDDLCVVVLGNCLYVLGELTNKAASKFDTAKRKWKEIPSMHNRKSSAFGVATQGKILFVMP